MRPLEGSAWARKKGNELFASNKPAPQTQEEKELEMVKQMSLLTAQEDEQRRNQKYSMPVDVFELSKDPCQEQPPEPHGRASSSKAQEVYVIKRSTSVSSFRSPSSSYKSDTDPPVEYREKHISKGFGGYPPKKPLNQRIQEAEREIKRKESTRGNSPAPEASCVYDEKQFKLDENDNAFDHRDYRQESEILSELDDEWFERNDEPIGPSSVESYQQMMEKVKSTKGQLAVMAQKSFTRDEDSNVQVKYAPQGQGKSPSFNGEFSMFGERGGRNTSARGQGKRPSFDSELAVFDERDGRKDEFPRNLVAEDPCSTREFVMFGDSPARKPQTKDDFAQKMAALKKKMEKEEERSRSPSPSLFLPRPAVKSEPELSTEIELMNKAKEIEELRAQVAEMRQACALPQMLPGLGPVAYGFPPAPGSFGFYPGMGLRQQPAAFLSTRFLQPTDLQLEVPFLAPLPPARFPTNSTPATFAAPAYIVGNQSEQFPESSGQSGQFQADWRDFIPSIPSAPSRSEEIGQSGFLRGNASQPGILNENINQSREIQSEEEKLLQIIDGFKTAGPDIDFINPSFLDRKISPSPQGQTPLSSFSQYMNDRLSGTAEFHPETHQKSWSPPVNYQSGPLPAVTNQIPSAFQPAVNPYSAYLGSTPSPGLAQVFRPLDPNLFGFQGSLDPRARPFLPGPSPDLIGRGGLTTPEMQSHFGFGAPKMGPPPGFERGPGSGSLQPAMHQWE